MMSSRTARIGLGSGTCSSADGRIPVLDGIRGLAIVLVMLHHCFQSQSPQPVALDRFVFGLASGGWSGVDLFFVLSGFLITGILHDSKRERHYFRNFYGRRTLRIFPLYYVVLFVFYIGFTVIPHPLPHTYIADSVGDQLWFWTYLTNFRIAARGQFYSTFIPGVLWSLAVEEQFYLVWPQVVRLFSTRTLVRICLGLFAAAFATRVAFALTGIAPTVTFVLTFTRMDCLALGALLALVMRAEGGLDRAMSWATRLGPACLVLIVFLALPHGTVEWKDPWMNTVGFSALALLYGSLLVMALHTGSGKWIRGIFEAGVMRMLGKYSYALYLLHGPVGTAVKQFYDWDSAPLVMGSTLPRTLLFTAVATLLSLFLAWMSWNLLERHFLALGRWFRNPAPVLDLGKRERAAVALRI